PSRNGAGYPDKLLSGKSVGLNTLEPLDICILLASQPNGAMAGSLPQGATLQRDGLLLERAFGKQDCGDRSGLKMAPRVISLPRYSFWSEADINRQVTDRIYEYMS